MATPANRQIRLKKRPVGMPTPDDFEIVATSVPDLRDGDVLRKTIYLSLDPYMRGRMSDAPSYAKSVDIGGVMVGHTVSRVLESRHPGFQAGDLVAGYDGWQEAAVSNGNGLRRLDGSLPATTALGVLGMPGLTAFVGLLDIGQPKSGETVVVSAAAGAVGSIVGQLAKIAGCLAVGVAGSAEKCRYVIDELGFDACVNYKTGNLADALAAACPQGIDVYFENVGGAVFGAVLRLLNTFARIPLCGLIADYNATQFTGVPTLLPLLVSRVTMRGFIIGDHTDRFAAFLKEVEPLVRSGRIKYREDIVDGLAAAPSALIGLFEGKNFGKMIVRVAPDAPAAVPSRGV
jgi:NADPH-dependent curcumin reductase CurA